MKKVVLKLEFNDDKIKQKAMQKVSGLSGVESLSIDTKDKKLTVIGDIDPVKLTAKLRKLCHTDIVSVGPAKEPEKKKDEQPKKDDGKKDDGKKKEGGGQGAPYPHYPPPLPYNHYPPLPAPAYYARSAEEDPNSCVIC